MRISVNYCKRHSAKKSVDFTVEYLASGYFYGRLPDKHFKKSRYGKVKLTDSTRKYLCRVVGLYNHKKKKKKKKEKKKAIHVVCYRTMPDFWKCLRAPVKWTGNGLADGCQLFYHKIYGYFYSAERKKPLHNWLILSRFVFEDKMTKYYSVWPITSFSAPYVILRHLMPKY